MRKIILLTIPLLIAVLSVLGWLAAETSQPPAWKTGLYHYLTIKNLVIQADVQASQPWNFNSDMSMTSYGSNPVSQTDTQNQQWPYSISVTSLITSGLITGDFIKDISPVDNPAPYPIAYPPEELWCVRLKPAHTVNGEGQFTIVFVARHQDLYNSGWLVHEINNDLSTTEMVDLLTKVGCERLVETDH